jgi:hypothetical protein
MSRTVLPAHLADSAGRVRTLAGRPADNVGAGGAAGAASAVSLAGSGTGTGTGAGRRAGAR